MARICSECKHFVPDGNMFGNRCDYHLWWHVVTITPACEGFERRTG